MARAWKIAWMQLAYPAVIARRERRYGPARLEPTPQAAAPPRNQQLRRRGLPDLSQAPPDELDRAISSLAGAAESWLRLSMATRVVKQKLDANEDLARRVNRGGGQ